MTSLDQNREPQTDSAMAQLQPDSNVPSNSNMPSWYSMLSSQSGTPAPASALSELSASSTGGYTALPYPSAGLSAMPTPGYYAPTQADNSIGLDCNAMSMDNTASARREIGLVVSANEGVPDESINLLVDAKTRANDQLGGAQVGVSGDASGAGGGAVVMAEQSADGVNNFSKRDKVRAITVGLLIAAICAAYSFYDAGRFEGPKTNESDDSSGTSASGLFVIFIFLSGLLSTSVGHKSKFSPRLLFYVLIGAVVVSVLVFIEGMYYMYNQELLPDVSDEHYERLVLSHKLKVALAPVLFVLTLSQAKLMYSKLRGDLCFVCICFKQFLSRRSQATTNN